MKMNGPDLSLSVEVKEVKWEESAWRHLAEAKLAAIKVSQNIRLAICVFS